MTNLEHSRVSGNTLFISPACSKQLRLLRNYRYIARSAYMCVLRRRSRYYKYRACNSLYNSTMHTLYSTQRSADELPSCSNRLKYAVYYTGRVFNTRKRRISRKNEKRGGLSLYLTYIRQRRSWRRESRKRMLRAYKRIWKPSESWSSYDGFEHRRNRKYIIAFLSAYKPQLKKYWKKHYKKVPFERQLREAHLFWKMYWYDAIGDALRSLRTANLLLSKYNLSEYNLSEYNVLQANNKEAGARLRRVLKAINLTLTDCKTNSRSVVQNVFSITKANTKSSNTKSRNTKSMDTKFRNTKYTDLKYRNTHTKCARTKPTNTKHTNTNHTRLLAAGIHVQSTTHSARTTRRAKKTHTLRKKKMRTLQRSHGASSAHVRSTRVKKAVILGRSNAWDSDAVRLFDTIVKHADWPKWSIYAIRAAITIRKKVYAHKKAALRKKAYARAEVMMRKKASVRDEVTMRKRASISKKASVSKKAFAFAEVTMRTKSASRWVAAICRRFYEPSVPSFFHRRLLWRKGYWRLSIKHSRRRSYTIKALRKLVPVHFKGTSSEPRTYTPYERAIMYINSLAVAGKYILKRRTRRSTTVHPGTAAVEGIAKIFNTISSVRVGTGEYFKRRRRRFKRRYLRRRRKGIIDIRSMQLRINRFIRRNALTIGEVASSVRRYVRKYVRRCRNTVRYREIRKYIRWDNHLRTKRVRGMAYKTQTHVISATPHIAVAQQSQFSGKCLNVVGPFMPIRPARMKYYGIRAVGSYRLYKRHKKRLRKRRDGRYPYRAFMRKHRKMRRTTLRFNHVTRLYFSRSRRRYQQSWYSV